MNNNMENKKFFLYARKSTDVEDKQVLSIDAQLTELREYAVRENIEISAEIVEKQSAKVPGRPLFNKIMKEIETFGGNFRVCKFGSSYMRKAPCKPHTELFRRNQIASFNTRNPLFAICRLRHRSAHSFVLPYVSFFW